MEEEKDVKETPSAPSALENAIASSPEAIEEVKQQIQETQTPTAEQGETQEQEEQQEEQRVPYSRFKEKVDEANYLKSILEKQIQAQQSQQQFQQPTQPQELGSTPEEREFWRMQRQVAAEEARKQIQQLNPVIEAARQEMAKIGVQLFRKEYPDIKPNSPEEMQIAEKIGQGYPAEDAYRIVMWDKKVAKTAEEKDKQVKQQIQAKKKANVETGSSIPIQSQPQPKKSFRETFDELYGKAERGEL